MTQITVIVGRLEISVSVDRQAPLGWRLWTMAGFPGDPVEPRPYGGSRCLPLARIDLDAGQRWLCAMELDGTFRLLCSLDLFPCLDQDGAVAFAHVVVERHAHQPQLL